MKIERLYIRDFMCYDHAYIDFSQFQSALIVGKQASNDDVSNGVGKTTIFRSIEYVLFNHSDENLDKIIQDESDSCSITLDFVAENQEYRLTRTRTRKGTTDLTLYKRTAAKGKDEEALHHIYGDKHSPLSDEKHWKNISGRRAADTEKEIAKLIKINIKSFRIFVHFMQNDFEGLTTATPERRKIILRDALNLVVYAKLEKIAKEKCSAIAKEAEKLGIMIEALGDPESVLVDLAQKIIDTDEKLAEQSVKLADLEIILSGINETINHLNNEHSGLESKFSELLVKKQSLEGEKSRIEISIKEYTTKKSNAIKTAKEIIAEIKQLEEAQVKLAEFDYNQIETLSEQIISNKEKVAQLSLTIQNDMARCHKLKKPIPAHGECEECRQPITPEHRKICQRKLDQELKDKQSNMQDCKKEIATLNSQNASHQQNVNNLTISKQQLEGINTKIAIKKKEVEDKKEAHSDHDALLKRFTTDLQEKDKEIEQVIEDLNNSSIEEAKAIQKQIQEEKKNAATISSQIAAVNKEIAHLNSSKAVFQHDKSKRNEEKRKKADYTKKMKALEEKLSSYPAVIQAFSSTGIPNLIIQGVLDDLQIEANKLLSQLKPGIQLSFLVSKIKAKDGTEVDTLDINYSVNGKKRYYKTISGSMQLAVNFSLKLGLSFILQKMIGVDIRFLLLDEIDQSLDNASVDYYADIVKLFQKEYTILVITHRDRLKNKFANAILVEQDIDGVSCAKVVSSW